MTVQDLLPLTPETILSLSDPELEQLEKDLTELRDQLKQKTHQAESSCHSSLPSQEQSPSASDLPPDASDELPAPAALHYAILQNLGHPKQILPQIGSIPDPPEELPADLRALWRRVQNSDTMEHTIFKRDLAWLRSLTEPDPVPFTDPVPLLILYTSSSYVRVLLKIVLAERNLRLPRDLVTTMDSILDTAPSLLKDVRSRRMKAQLQKQFRKTRNKYSSSLASLESLQNRFQKQLQEAVSFPLREPLRTTLQYLLSVSLLPPPSSRPAD